MSDTVITVRGLRKHYGRVIALQDLDLDVPRGAVFGLLGPNGAGKSTTFGILCGWLHPTAGMASVLGTPSTELYRLRGRVAVLPQDAAFPPQISVALQLEHFGRLSGMSRKEALGEAGAALEAVGLADAARLKGSQLSHGMLKRVGLAQAIIGHPEVIFLDEPTAGLDPKSARQIKDLIASLAPTSTVVLSSHNLVDVQEICTDGAILDHGRLAMAGSIAQLTRRGAEVTIELGPQASPPMATLGNAFGEDHVALVEPNQLRIVFASDSDAAEVIGRALRLLLDAGTPILGVHRGTSLEKAFLEVTGDASS